MAFDMCAAMGKRIGAATPSIVMIDVDNLEPNEKNFYRVSGDVEIEKQNEQLKATIEMYGIEQPLIVKAMPGGKYNIIAGERRYLACRRLADEGNTERRVIPCIVRTIQSAEDEEIEIIITNHHRDKSLSEKIEEVRKLADLLQRKRDNGEKVPGRIQDIIAECLNLSKSEVGRLQQIDKNLDPSLKEAIKDHKLAMTPAVELSKMSAADQKAVYEETGGAVTTKDVQKMRKAEPAPAVENMSITGFTPTPPAKQEPVKAPTVSDEKLWAVMAMQDSLKKEVESRAEELITAEENGNEQGAANITALIDYIAKRLLPTVEKDLFDLKGQDMFGK